MTHIYRCNCAFHACDNCKNTDLSVASIVLERLCTGKRLVKGRKRTVRPEFFSCRENTTVCKVFFDAYCNSYHSSLWRNLYIYMHNWHIHVYTVLTCSVVRFLYASLSNRVCCSIRMCMQVVCSTPTSREHRKYHGFTTCLLQPSHAQTAQNCISHEKVSSRFP